MHILDSQISRALIAPTPWEEAQYRRAALREKAEWSKLIDLGSSHRFCDDVQRSIDTEIRRERMWCGPAPAVVGAAPVPSELPRAEHAMARVTFCWLRADNRVVAGSNMGSALDKVATTAEGAIYATARDVSSSHAFTQATAGLQAPDMVTAAQFNNRAVIPNNSAVANYASTIAESNWRWTHNANHAIYVAARATSTTWGSIHNSANTGASNVGCYLSLGRVLASNAGHNCSGWLMNGSGTFYANNEGANESAPLNSAILYSFKHVVSTSYAIRSAIPKSVATSGSPAAGAATSTMGLFALNGGGVAFLGQWADSVMCNRTPSGAEDTLINRYFTLRYGGLLA